LFAIKGFWRVISGLKLSAATLFEEIKWIEPGLSHTKASRFSAWIAKMLPWKR
jgi:hypothetical protein